MKVVAVRSSSISIVIILALALFASACSDGVATVEDNGLDVATILRDPSSVLGTRVTLRGLPVFWTATLVSEQGEILQRPTSEAWICVAVVDPTRATRGLLVRVRAEQSIETMARQTSARVRIEGPLRTFSNLDLVAYMKEHHGLEVAVAGNGQPLCVEDDLALPAASPQPVTMPTAEVETMSFPTKEKPSAVEGVPNP